MGNQQAKVEDWELGWLCGFIDGEGSIMLNEHRNHDCKKTCWRPRITVCNTDNKSLNKVTDILDRLGLAYNVSWRFPQKDLASWDLRAYGLQRVKRWLLVITPYLVTKKWKAEIMLDFINTRLEHSQRDPYTAREEDLIFLLRGMNRQLASTTTRRTQLVMV